MSITKISCLDNFKNYINNHKTSYMEDNGLVSKRSEKYKDALEVKTNIQDNLLAIAVGNFSPKLFKLQVQNDQFEIIGNATKLAFKLSEADTSLQWFKSIHANIVMAASLEPLQQLIDNCPLLKHNLAPGIIKFKDTNLEGEFYLEGKCGIFIGTLRLIVEADSRSRNMAVPWALEGNRFFWTIPFLPYSLKSQGLPNLSLDRTALSKFTTVTPDMEELTQVAFNDIMTQTQDEALTTIDYQKRLARALSAELTKKGYVGSDGGDNIHEIFGRASILYKDSLIEVLVEKPHAIFCSPKNLPEIVQVIHNTNIQQLVEA